MSSSGWYFFMLPFAGLNKGFLPVLKGNGNIYHHDMLAVFVDHNDVRVQLALTVWVGTVDGHGPR